MGDTRIQSYQQVVELVSKGVTSPSVVLRRIPAIQNWRTARKYISEALGELSKEESYAKKEEYFAQLEGLKMLRSELFLKLEEQKDTNQYLGIVKNIVGINCILFKLLSLENFNPTWVELEFPKI